MKYKYKKQFATGALTLSLLVGGSSVFAASPQDLGIKNVQSTYQKQDKSKNSKYGKTKNSGRKGVVGSISVISTTGFTIEIKNMKTKAISSTEIKTDTGTIYTKNGKSATASDLAVGQKVIMMGALDKTTNIITAKTVKMVVKVPKVANSKTK